MAARGPWKRRTDLRGQLPVWNPVRVRRVAVRAVSRMQGVAPMHSPVPFLAHRTRLSAYRGTQAGFQTCVFRHKNGTLIGGGPAGRRTQYRWMGEDPGLSLCIGGGWR